MTTLYRKAAALKNKHMKRSILLKCALVAAFALAFFTMPLKAANAAGPSGSLSNIIAGCYAVNGTATATGFPGATTTLYEIGIYDRANARYLGGATGELSGVGPNSFFFQASWQPALPAGAIIEVDMFIVNPITSEEIFVVGVFGGCNPNPVFPGGVGQSYYPAADRVMATVKYDTPIYSEPDLKGLVVGTLKAGQTWYLVGTAHNQTWYQVFVAGPQYAWVPAAAVSPQGKVPRGNTLYPRSS